MPESVTEALGWTILHSLWQAAVIGLIAWLILNSRKQASPQFRYLVGTLSMLGILVCSVLTFMLEYQSESTIVMTPSLTRTETFRESMISLSAETSGLTLSDVFLCFSFVFLCFPSTSFAKPKKIQTVGKIYTFLIILRNRVHKLYISTYM